MEGRFMKFLPLTGPDYLPRIVIVQEPEKRSNCCSVFWDWAIKVIGSVVATAGLGWILWYGLAWAMEKSDQDTALANWNALANYIKYCEGLSKTSRDERCVKAVKEGLPPPPAYKEKTKISNDKTEDGVVKLSNTAAGILGVPKRNVISEITIKRWEEPLFFIDGGRETSSRLLRDCHKAWERCIDGDWVPGVTTVEYDKCYRATFEGAKSVALGLDCGRILGHWIPEYGRFHLIPFNSSSIKAKEGSWDYFERCDYSRRMCNAMMSIAINRLKEPQTQFERDWDFYHWHAVHSLPFSPSISVPENLQITYEKSAFGPANILAMLVVPVLVVWFRRRIGRLFSSALRGLIQAIYTMIRRYSS